MPGGFLFCRGGDELEFGFDVLAGFFGLFAADVVEFDRGTVVADMGGYDVAVGVAGVVMAVHEIGLFAEAYLLHVALGDGLHLIVGELVGGVKVEGNMLGGFDPFVELHASFEGVELVSEAEARCIFQEVGGDKELGLSLCNFLFVIGQGAGDVVGGHYFGSHGWRDFLFDWMDQVDGWMDQVDGWIDLKSGRRVFRYGLLFPVLW